MSLLGSLSGYAEEGGKTVLTDSLRSTTTVQQSYVAATVTVYAAGTTTLSTIYSDSSGVSAKTNPFTSDTNGYWSFFAADGNYDIKFSGTNITTPWTLSSQEINTGSLNLPFLNVKNAPYNAVGDGVADDSVAIQAAINAAGTTVLSNTVVIPQGKYKCLTGLTIINQGVRLTGVSAYSNGTISGSVILAGTSGMTLLQLGNQGSSKFVDHVVIENLALDGNTALGATGLLLQNTHQSEFRNMTVRNFSGNGIDVQDEIYDVAFYNVESVTNNRGLYAHKTGANSVQKLQLFNCRMYGNTADNLLAEAVTTLGIYGGEFEQGARGIGISKACISVTISGVQCESNTTADIDFFKDTAASTTPAATGANIIGGTFIGNNVSPFAIKVAGASNVAVIEPYTSTHVTGAINFTNAGLTNYLNLNCSLIGGFLNEASTQIVNKDALSVYNAKTWSVDQGFTARRNMTDAFSYTAPVSCYQEWVARGTVAVSGGTVAAFAVTAVTGYYKVMAVVNHAGGGFAFVEAFITVSGNPPTTTAVTSIRTGNEGSGALTVTAASAGGILTVTLTNSNGFANLYAARLQAVSQLGGWTQ